MKKILQLKRGLKSLGRPDKVKVYANFFKTGVGQYGEGDVFIGVTVPDQRKIARQYSDLDFSDVKLLLKDPIHEYRLTAILILVEQFQNASSEGKKIIYDFYIKNITGVNNWDLVDVSAPKIIGTFLIDKSKEDLYKLAKTNNLWQRRIAIVSTLAFIKNNELVETFKIAKILLNDNHDLIHKSVGWMLREAGKKDQKKLEKYLDQYSRQMPRTMLRYAIERFGENLRKSYLKNK